MSTTERELVIVGAGPAGVSAALWARSRHLDVIVLESGGAPGGQLAHVHFQPREIVGWLSGDGPALAMAMTRQLAGAGVPVRYGIRAEGLTVDRDLTLRLTGGDRIRARAVLVATGARRRRLDVPGEREFEGRGVSFSATLDRERLAGRPVVVVGGGDAAFENALLLAGLGGEITVVVRGEVRARREFRERLAAERRALVLRETRVVAVLGDERVSAVRVRGPQGVREFACEGVVVKVGVSPNTEWCADVLGLDGEGFIRVDASLATTLPGVWAAGDVTRPALAAVPVAAGHGALAIAAIRAALRSL